MKTLVSSSLLICFSLLPLSAQQNATKTASKQTSDAFGHVEFANSGARAAQADFLAGMALLHDFEYASAAEAFRSAETADPGFAMAYWGEAMTYNHPIWMQQDLPAGRGILRKLGPTPAERLAKAKTEREKAYLRAAEVLYGEGSKLERDLLYEAAMAKLHADYPDDVDGAAFYGLAILGTAHAGRDTATYMRAAGVLEQAWIDHREHPGLVHYLIHCYDDPAHAPLGLRAARIYARIAPDAGHAQHMTSHIFVALGMWQEVVKANINAIAVVNKLRAQTGKGPAGCGHYPTWLNYGNLQLGRTAEARAAVAQCRATLETQSSTHPPSTSMDPDNSDVASYANMRLRFVVDAGTLPADMSDWVIPKTAGPGARLDYDFARFLNELTQRNRARALDAIKDLEAAGKEVIDQEKKNADPDPSYGVRPEILLLEAKALLAEVDNDNAEAERLLKQAVALEESLPIAFGPPVIDKPTHELLGEFLLRRGRKDEARVQFEKAVARTPGRRLAVNGLLAAGSR